MALQRYLEWPSSPEHGRGPLDVSEVLRFAIAQMTSTDDWNLNSAAALALVREAKALGEFDIIGFPENALYMRIDRTEKIVAVSLADSIFDPFADLAREMGVYIYFGSVPLLIGSQVFNSAVLFSPAGERSFPVSKDSPL